MKYATTLEGDKIVAKDMEVIKKAIEGLSFESLVLYGAFGRGEGLVLEGKPRNDYDLLLVGGDRKVKRAIEKAKTGCVNEVWHLKELGQPKCSQQWFEIKYASQLLAGKPLELPEWQPWDIPYSDALNSLERRVVSMLVAKWEMGKEQPDERKIIEQIDKMIIAIGDATLIKRGQFHPKYSVRALMLSQDPIGNIYQLAVSTKILGWPELSSDALWQLWHQTRNLYREYIVKNQIKPMVGELLIGLSDRTPRENLKRILIKLKAKKWL